VSEAVRPVVLLYILSQLNKPSRDCFAAQAKAFLQGAWDVDAHFRDAPLRENLPVMLGLLSVWNVSFLDTPARAILPYCQVCHTNKDYQMYSVLPALLPGMSYK
jgi:hypothetical protein